MKRVYVLNTGSRTLKWSLLASDGRTLGSGEAPWAGDDPAARKTQVRTLLRDAPDFDAIGHRVVHGGPRFSEAVRIDRAVREALGGLAGLDPAHMPLCLDAIDAALETFPSLPQVAAFDTAFHAALPAAAAGYALPRDWTERWGLRRYGFHGLSVAYAVRRVPELTGAPRERLVVCHLGGGCSVTAVRDGRSQDTTMGFSSLEGLVMPERSGSVDPGLLLYLQERCGIGVGELREALTRRSGLRGISGLSGDLREVLSAAREGSAPARLAYDRFVLSLRRAVGAAAAVLGGVDAIVFTGGIGENSPDVRRDALAPLGFLGVSTGDDSGNGDRDIASADASVRVLVIRAREDLSILAEVLRLV